MFTPSMKYCPYGRRHLDTHVKPIFRLVFYVGVAAFIFIMLGVVW